MNDKEKDFEEAFNDAYDRWFPWLSEAHTDFKYVIDDPWTEADKQYFRDEQREILNFNITRRIVKLITGYERRNRLSLKIGGQEGSDDQVASQYTGIIMHLMENRGGYGVVSDAFELGSLITGMNLIELHLDRRGDISFARKPYNTFLLDPHFFKRDLSDCKYIITHDEGMLTEDVKTLLPGKESLIEQYAKMPEGTALPFSAYKGRGRDEGTRVNYSVFWERQTRKVKYIGNRQSNQKFEWTGTKDQLDATMQQFPMQLTSWDDWKETVVMSSYVNGLLVHEGKDPNKIDDYPFTNMSGFWYPEYDDQALKLQGIVRPVRDPQREVSKRLSKILDIIDSQVSTGVIAEENSLVDPDDLHASGQGKGIMIKEGKMGAVQRIESGDIKPGLFQLNHDLQSMINDIAGVNDSMFGTEELKNQMSGFLMKLRQGAGLVQLQDLFDHKRFSMKQLGFKLAKMVKANYPDKKIARIINEQPVPNFRSIDLEDYDLVPQEGILTETQRQMAYVEILHLKKLAADMNEGHVIPWSVVMDFLPMQMKHRVKELIKQNEQAMAESRQQEAKERQLTEAMKQAKIAADMGRAKERHAQVERDKASAALSRAKTAREIKKMDDDQFTNIIDKAIKLENINMQREKNKAMTRR